MLTVRFGQLTVGGLSPPKIRSLAGCSQTPSRFVTAFYHDLFVENQVDDFMDLSGFSVTASLDNIVDR